MPSSPTQNVVPPPGIMPTIYFLREKSRISLRKKILFEWLRVKILSTFGSELVDKTDPLSETEL